ncbi:MAG: 16S rRNA (cytosine(1402)-N(4))-methyltransferase RsmH [Tannerella sp.]|jgi:16S rRNA (cytosine1402-N4)-methyltransferase|nr:16S rRNA (cytosine(1402)-N(4))-methyltransferase RsmH [Tannerella sp.]
MNKEGFCYHTPVLFDESLNGLQIVPSGVYIDVTFGGGGHSSGILNRLGDAGHLYGFDQDGDTEAYIPSDPRFTFVRSNFRYLSNFMRYHGVAAVDGIFADLGVSSHHFDEASRGFSFRFNGSLDMRMNNRKGTTAAEILNTFPEERLAYIFHNYGELTIAKRLAAQIVASRVDRPIQTIEGFLEILNPYIRKDKEKKILARAFQALRIQTNDELEALSALLRQSVKILKPGGRFVIITYHSLEDRMVKNFFRTGNFEGKIEQDFYGNRISPLRPVNTKVITPSMEEVNVNPRARSAKLRIGERL